MQNAKCKIILATAQQKHPPQSFFCGGLTLSSSREPLGSWRSPLLCFNEKWEITTLITFARNDDLFLVRHLNTFNSFYFPLLATIKLRSFPFSVH